MPLSKVRTRNFPAADYRLDPRVINEVALFIQFDANP